MPPETPPENIADIAQIAQIAGFVAGMVLLAILSRQWGARRERGRQERNEALSTLGIIRQENTRNFDEMRDRLRHIESRLDANARPTAPADAKTATPRAAPGPLPE